MALLTPSTLAGPVQAPAGGGTTGTLPKWASANTLADSIVTESGVTVTASGGSASDVTLAVANTTASSAADATLSAAVVSGSGGDPQITWLIPGAIQWTAGLDNSASDVWKLSASGALGTSDILIANTSVYVYGPTRLGTGAVAPLFPLHITTGDAVVESTQVGTTLTLEVRNEDTGNTASHARLYAVTGAAGGGNPYAEFIVVGAQSWTIGVDNADSDTFKIAASGALNSSTVATFYTTGQINLNLGDVYVTRAKVGTVIAGVYNQSANAAADARLEIQVQSTAAGDPYVYFLLNGGQSWTLGSDNSDSDKFKLCTGAIGTGDTLTVTAAGLITAVTGDIAVGTAGKGLKIAEGSNAKMGQSALTNGTVTVSTTAVTASSRIQLTRAVGAGTTRGVLTVGTIVAATSFVIRAEDLVGNLSADDDSTVNWLIVEPA